MGYYDNLSPSVQNLVMLNFQTMGKYLLLGFAILFSFWFVFFYWKNKKDSNYLLFGLARLLVYLVSIAIIAFTPMMIFFLYPQIALDTILYYMIVGYTIGFFVMGILITLNIFYHGAGIIVSFAGVKYDPKVQKVKKKFFVEILELMGFKIGGRNV
jgi:hypothetical protein